MLNLATKLRQTNYTLSHLLDTTLTAAYAKQTRAQQLEQKQKLKSHVKNLVSQLYNHVIHEMECHYVLDVHRVVRKQTANYLIESHFTPMVLHRSLPKLVSPLAKTSTSVVYDVRELKQRQLDLSDDVPEDEPDESDKQTDLVYKDQDVIILENKSKLNSDLFYFFYSDTIYLIY